MHSLLCHQHSSSPGSVRVPFSWLEMVQRSMISAFDVLSGKDKLKTQGWVQVWMLLTPDLPMSVRWVTLSHGVRGPCSMFMPGSTRSSRVPDPALHQKAASVATEPGQLLGGLMADFGTVISVRVTSGPSSFCQLTESCVASCRQYRSHPSVQVSD